MKKPPTKTAPKKASAPAAVPMSMHSAEDMKYRAQDALHTLKRAHEIKSDPHLMKHVKEHAKTEKKVLSSVMRRKT